jgi:ketosteroid isomerase-like protein
MKALAALKFVLVGLLALMPLTAVAQEENKADHDALRNIRKVAESAINRNDLDIIRPYLAPEFSIVTFTDREFTDFEAFKAQWEKTRRKMLGERGSFKVDLDPVLSLIKGDIALCRGNAKNTLVDDSGNVFEFTSHWTATCQKVGDKWLIARAHNSLDPFHNPMLEHAVRSLLLKAVAVAALIGLLLGAALVWLRCRRKGGGTAGQGGGTAGKGGGTASRGGGTASRD